MINIIKKCQKQLQKNLKNFMIKLLYKIGKNMVLHTIIIIFIFIPMEVLLILKKFFHKNIKRKNLLLGMVFMFLKLI